MPIMGTWSIFDVCNLISDVSFNYFSFLPLKSSPPLVFLINELSVIPRARSYTVICPLCQSGFKEGNRTRKKEICSKNFVTRNWLAQLWAG